MIPQKENIAAGLKHR